MTESEFFIRLAEILSGSPSLFASIVFGAFLLKKYVINGSVNAFLDIKRQELASLDSIKKSLIGIIDCQEKIYSELSEKVSS